MMVIQYGIMPHLYLQILVLTDFCSSLEEKIIPRQITRHTSYTPGAVINSDENHCRYLNHHNLSHGKLVWSSSQRWRRNERLVKRHGRALSASSSTMSRFLVMGLDEVSSYIERFDD